MKVLFTGSRGWKDPFPVDVVIAGLVTLADGRDEKLVVVHGHSPKGLDQVVDRVARRWGAEVIREPVTREEWAQYKGGGGSHRNQRMLDNHPDIEACYAFRAYGKSNGTDDMTEKAEGAGIPTYKTSGGVHPTD